MESGIRAQALALVITLSAGVANMSADDCSGKLAARWSDDGRAMTLTEDFTYTDPYAVKWLAPKGCVIDGASIPQIFWSLIGGPYEGKYRKASVVHDVACKQQTRPWRQVHRMFYDAMRCSGVTRPKALGMYWAVFQCGPRWGNVGNRLFPCGDDAKMQNYLLTLVGALEKDEVSLHLVVITPKPEDVEQLSEQDLQAWKAWLGTWPVDMHEPVSPDDDSGVVRPRKQKE